MTKKIVLSINNKLWQKNVLANNKVFYTPKYFNTNLEATNFRKWQTMSLPYIEVHYDNNEIKNIEAYPGAVRSTPLFYYDDDGDSIVSDSVEDIAEIFGTKELNELSVAEFLNFGLVTNNRTLLKDVMGLQAGEIFFLNERGLAVEDLYIYNNSGVEVVPEEDFTSEFKKTAEDVFHDLIISLKGKTAVVPLSGGYDSRFILVMLHLGGFEDVVTYSWGINDNTDMRIGQSVAGKLGYEWHPVVYNRNTWEAVFDSDWFESCMHYSHNYTSIPGCASLPFIDYFKQNEKDTCDKPFVFIPGLGGALAVGSWTKYLNNYQPEDVNDLGCLIHKHYGYYTENHLNQEVMDETVRQIANNTNYNGHNMDHLLEAWLWRERRAKFECNVTRFYEYLNYSWATPLFDKRFLDFWGKADYSMKSNKLIYKSMLDQLYFRKLKVDLRIDSNGRFNLKQNIIKHLKEQRFFKRHIKYLRGSKLSKKMVPPDVFGFDFALPVLAEKMKNKNNDCYERVRRLKVKGHSENAISQTPYSHLADYILVQALHSLNLFK